MAMVALTCYSNTHAFDAEALRTVCTSLFCGWYPRILLFRSESLVPEECSLEELESGEIRAICSSDGEEYIYKVINHGI